MRLFKSFLSAFLFTSLAFALEIQTTPQPNPMTAGGDLIYGGTNGAQNRLANGSVNQFLQSAGSTTAPTWSSTLTGATAASLTISGDVTLVAGGISFPSSAVACSTNLLCDYQQGTFTAVVEGASVAGAGTYSTQQAWYRKIGSMLFFGLRLIWSAHTGTGDFRLAGLPYTVQNDLASAGGVGGVLCSNYAWTAGHFVSALYIIPNDTRATMYSTATGGGAATNVAIDTAADCTISGNYYTNVQ